MRLVRRASAVLLVTAAVAPLASYASAADPAAEAAAILKATGIRGGLVVHLGCSDGRLTAALRASEAYLVHGLDPDPSAVARARKYLMSRGLYGPVTVQVWAEDYLPYSDQTVNLLVASKVGRVPAHEIMRVLAPGGVAYVRRGRHWVKRVKPWPDDIDEWTHYLHGPDNNAVAKDYRVGPPRHLRWVCPPRWARSHEHLASISVAVSSAGRIFYIADEGPAAAIGLPPRWSVIARDAFSGVLLWKRPIKTWENHLRPFRSGPPHIGRRLVAVGDRVYVTLGYGEPVSALDAATGRTVKVYRGTEGTDEIIFCDGVLYLVVGDPQLQKQAAAKRRGGYVPPPQRDVAAVDARSGKILWRKSDEDTRGIMPATLCVAQGRVLFQNLHAVVCLDAKTGERLWVVERPVPHRRPAWSTATLVVYKNVVLSADRGVAKKPEKRGPADRIEWYITTRPDWGPPGELIALRLEDGTRLWSAPCYENYTSPPDVIVANGLVWTGILRRRNEPGMTDIRDPFTGEVKMKRPPDQKFISVGMGHHRCHRERATERYIVLGRAGVELLDTHTGVITANHWLRGTCQFGVLPCNGMLYVPPHSCACYIYTKLSGFNALASEVEPWPETAGRLEKGPAYGQAAEEAEAPGGEWPTYRHDPARSGRASCSVPDKPDVAWRVRLGGKLTAPVVAGGRLFVARQDVHTLYALDAASGRRLWSFTADGRIDSPPTVWRGRVYFGARDGWVYCLRALDGALVWRFHAAPSDRLIYSYGQLESLWPVHGNVLVYDGSAYFAAGRNPFLDGGIWLWRVDAVTGKVLARRVINLRDPKTGLEPQETVQATSQKGVLPDVLSADGGLIFMRHRAYDPETLEDRDAPLHLFCPTGFLDDSWWHRTYWQYGNQMIGGWGGWPRMGNVVPSGRILCVGPRTVYGFGRVGYGLGGAHVGLQVRYRLYAAPKPTLKQFQQIWKKYRRRRPRPPAAVPVLWQTEPPVAARAMLLAGDRLLVAGPADHRVRGVVTGVPDNAPAVMVVFGTNGKKLGELRLPACPVFDSLAAARGRLYMATVDGEVLCLSKER